MLPPTTSEPYSKLRNLVKNIQKSLVYPIKPIKVHFYDNLSVISAQIVHLPLIFANSAVFTVEYWVVLALTHTVIL